jgi:hypothetical protein
MKKHRRCNSVLSKLGSPIKEKLKLSAWASYHGNSFNGLCYTCNRVIYYDDFRVGQLDVRHPVSIENIRPICKICLTASDLISLSSLRGNISSGEHGLVGPSAKSKYNVDVPTEKEITSISNKKEVTDITISCCMISFIKRTK